MGTIVAGVASGGSGFIAAANAGSKLYGQISAEDSTLASLWDQREVLKKDLEDVAKGANTVTEAVGKIRDAVSQLTPQQRKLPNFVMEREMFDKVAKDFADISEASEYRDMGYDFLKAVETRNQAIVDYNAALAQLIEFEARIIGARRAGLVIQDRLNAQADPSEPLLIALMSRLYIDSLDAVASFIHRAKKAMGYLFGEHADARLSALNMSQLNGEFIALKRTWAETKERNRLRQRVSGLVIPLKEIVSEQAWQLFLTTGRLGFAVNRDHPVLRGLLYGLPGLRITSVRIAFPGATAGAEDQIPWTMFQGGCELVYRAPRIAIGDDGEIAMIEKPATFFSKLPFGFRGTTSISGRPPIVEADIAEEDLYVSRPGRFFGRFLNKSGDLARQDLRASRGV